MPPSPCAGAFTVINAGQAAVNIDGQQALGDGCQFICPKGQVVSRDSFGQNVAKHNEASASSEAASLVLDVIPIVGSLKSALELIIGKDSVTGEEKGRWGSAGGIALGMVPGAKILTKGKKANKIAKAIFKKGKPPTKVAPPASAAVGNRSLQNRNVSFQKTRNPPGKILDREYTGHALDQMQNRGIPPRVVENTVQTGVKKEIISEGVKTTNYYDPVNKVSVVLNENGNVITVGHGKIGR